MYTVTAVLSDVGRARPTAEDSEKECIEGIEERPLFAGDYIVPRRLLPTHRYTSAGFNSVVSPA